MIDKRQTPEQHKKKRKLKKHVPAQRENTNKSLNISKKKRAGSNKNVKKTFGQKHNNT